MIYAGERLDHHPNHQTSSGNAPNPCATDVTQSAPPTAKAQVDGLEGDTARIPDKDEVRGSSSRGPTGHSPGETPQEWSLTRAITQIATIDEATAPLRLW
jgi:hypothetical protein